MENSEGILSFLDLMDLDEDLVDTRLKTIMDRNNHSKTQLANALQLLQYKNLINTKDKTDCENIEEFNFLIKLIKNINPDIVENVCIIIKLVLSLDSNTLVSNSQHLIQQVLANIDLSNENPKIADHDSESSNNLIYFKICDSVLDTVIQYGLKIELFFMDLPLEKVICHADDKVRIHFITSTIPKIFQGIEGYNILDKVWAYVQELNETELALKVLSCLSDYYLPAVDAKGKANFDSDVVFHCELWQIILNGLMSVDYSCRKISVYLAKRAIDYLGSKGKSTQIISEKNIILLWDPRRSGELRKQWDNFFILIDSLEEKQSNIVLPSLQIFDSLKELNFCWLNCAFNLGLKHDNSQVRLKSVQYRLKRDINSVMEATVLLQALDDINFYETEDEIRIIKENLKSGIKDSNVQNILKAIPLANLSPVPLFHVTDVLRDVPNLHVVFICEESALEVLSDIVKVPCNNIPLRKAFHTNLAHFIAQTCQGLSWKVLSKLFAMQLELSEMDVTQNPIVGTLLKLTFKPEKNREFYEHVTNTLLDVDYGLFYLDNCVKDIDLYIEIIQKKIQKISDIVNRQYSNKQDCFIDALIILKIFTKCKVNNTNAREIIKDVIIKDFRTILHYIFCLLTNNTALSVDESKSLLSYLTYPDEQIENNKDIILQLYKSALIILSDTNIQLEYTALSISLVNSLSNNNIFINNFKHEMLNIKSLVNISKVFEKIEFNKAESVGRLKNTFYEKHSETVNTLLEVEKQIDEHLVDIVEYLDKITECGGYGCLYWILKIMNKITKNITENDHIKFDINDFIHRMWREIEELKTNNLNYSPCMEEFAQLITQDALLNKPTFNNTILLYCTKIIEYGPIKNNPLYYLARELSKKEIQDHGHLVLILGELLFYCPVSRKDHRITDNLTIEILENKRFLINNSSLDQHFTFEIQYAAIEMLSRIKDTETLDVLLHFITNKIDNIFKNKVRYHGNSQIHRTIQTGLQHLMLLLMIYPKATKILDWAVQLLGKLPHQHSVRICLEWTISLCFYMQDQQVNSEILNLLKSKNVPIPSQFIIMYWLLKHKIKNGTSINEEYEYVLDNLLNNTMGQLFNIRLHAQYLSTKLYAQNNNNKKYDYTIEVINRTLTENANDKNFVRLKEDYFVNEFDIISNLTPLFLYYVMPKLCDSCNGEIVNIEYVTQSVKNINKNITKSVKNVKFLEEWSQSRIEDVDLINIELIRQNSKLVEELEVTATLQKKYIPWKNMSDVNAYETTKKRESTSDLIVVASLIDKLPNLGGLARTSEVFGVRTYVVDSLRHLHDKQFQGLSVSAERWIDVEEVRPGQPLKDYLNRKKAEGYAVVAAEQTSTSSKLQSFKFPRKTLLLLGHEKEGIPCNLLPMMDHCVEIPQQGFVRSLNVHVTAAIFVWEYARQNLL